VSDQDKEQYGAAFIVVALAVLLAIGVAIGVPVWQMSHAPAALPAAPDVMMSRAFEAGTLEARYAEGELVLSGRVPDADSKHRILSKAQVIFGAEHVKDEIDVDADAAPIWWKARPLDVFARLRQLPEFWLSLSGKTVSMKARLVSEESKAAFTEWLQGAFVDGGDIDATGFEVDSATATSAYDPNMLFDEHIEFPLGSAEVPEEVKPRLDLIAEGLKDYDRLVHVVGHTDSTGEAATNMTLSLERATSVVDYLVRQGVPADQLRAEGMGQDKPVADNETEEGRQKNRRIEFVSE
jgi:OmpA-OmpF porin, OOP family